MDHQNSAFCRVCMQSAMELEDLNNDIGNGFAFTLLESFNYCTQLNALPDDELPNHLCTPCCNELRVAFGFIQKAQQADAILRSKLQEDNETPNFIIIQTEESFEEELFEERVEIGVENTDEEIDIVYATDTSCGQINQPVESFQPEEQSENIEEYAKTEASSSPELVSEKGQFPCPRCLVVFETRSLLEIHISAEHSDKKHLCNVCGETFSTKYSFNVHLCQSKRKKPYSCQVCNKRYFTKNGLRVHNSTTHAKNSCAKYLCSVCGKEFATKQRLDVHHLTHTGERNFDCSLCGKKFATPFRLRNHVRIHTGEKPYQCQTCGVKFAQSNALKCHERIHTGEKPYKCEVCGKRFNQNTILKTHMTLHTGKKVQCPMCDKKFSRPSCLILHQREHTGEKPYVCYKCPNRYKQKSHLDRHLDTHFGIKHKCNICNKEYSKRSSLKIHMFEHTGEKPFQCPDCQEQFTRKDKYKAHLKRRHSKMLVQNEVMDLVKLEGDTKAVITKCEEILIEVEGVKNNSNKSKLRKTRNKQKTR